MIKMIRRALNIAPWNPIPEEKVIELDLGVWPEGGAPMPSLFQDEHDAALVFRAVSRASGVGGDGGGVVAIQGCSVAKFGYPNDEALGGHPLYSKGLGHYAFYEVEGSSWMRMMDEQNRVCFPNSSVWSGSRHFVITFHDSTFECVAASMSVAFTPDGYRDVLQRLATAWPQKSRDWIEQSPWSQFQWTRA